LLVTTKKAGNGIQIYSDICYLLTNSKMIDFELFENDAPEFIKNLGKIVEDRILKWKPEELYITQIDNWFDDKWLDYGGNLTMHVPVWRTPDLKIPPFHPNRVVRFDYYVNNKFGYVKKEISKPLHIIQVSSDNLRRNIGSITNNGLFIWYSGNSKLNNRGSIMIYYVHDKECDTFYVSLVSDKGWNVQKRQSALTKEIHELLSSNFPLSDPISL
jgi:hypothetical protein